MRGQWRSWSVVAAWAAWAPGAWSLAMAPACSSSDSPGNAGGVGGAAAEVDAGLDELAVVEEAAPVDEAAAPDAPTDAESEPEVVLPCGESQQICCGPSRTCSEGLTCSDQFCLTCGPPPTPREGCVNVALGATATAQQTFPANPLAALNDNDICQSWSSGDYPGVGGTWVQLDLGAAKTIDAMTFWVKQTPSHADVTLTLATSLDGVTWTPWGAESLVQTLDDNKPWEVAFVPPLVAQYVKATFVSSPSFVSVRELALYACAVP